jgi:dTDP-4-amino-4,6-dideoxygalactose transaminase
MINVNKSYLPPKEAYLQYLDSIWESHWLSNKGPLLLKLEQKISEYLKTGYVQLISNGTVAIQLAIKALDIKGEVITTPYSYVATTGSLLWENCKPVFCDINPDDFCLNPDLIEQQISPHTSAILATHVYGLPCAVERIGQIAKKHRLKVIYDAAHAFGCNYKGRSLLDYGDISTCSLHATKIFHTVEGGLVITRDKSLHEKIFLQKSFGHINDTHYCVGINGKNSEFHAAMGLCLIDFMSLNISKRRQLHDRYKQLLIKAPLAYPSITPELEYNYAYFPVLFESEKVMLEVRDMLIKNGVNTRRYFFPSLNQLPYLESKQSCPVSEDASSRVMALPFYYDLSYEEVELISGLICKYFA